jgi:bifunctional ADP-heptose synthase (sugar kinase/adenylyltransferase)
MDRYLIETLHAEQNCRNLVHLVNAAPGISIISTGAAHAVCIEVRRSSIENEAQARLTVPLRARCRASVLKNVKFTQSMLNSISLDFLAGTVA